MGHEINILKMDDHTSKSHYNLNLPSVALTPGCCKKPSKQERLSLLILFLPFLPSFIFLHISFLPLLFIINDKKLKKWVIKETKVQ